MKTTRYSLLVLYFLAIAGYASAAENDKGKFEFAPDTTTLKTHWSEFFQDETYTHLSTDTKKGITDKLFLELIQSDTNYLTWPVDWQVEAKKIFYTRAGFPPTDAEKLTTNKLLSNYDPEETAAGQEKKEARLGAATTQSNPAKLSSPVVDVNKNTPSTQIPKLPWRDRIGMSFRYNQYRVNNVELDEYKELSSLDTFSWDQVVRFIFLDRKVSIAQGGGGETVYIIRDEDEYHTISCPRLGKLPEAYQWPGCRSVNYDSFPIPLSRAKLAFHPCPICDPPQ